MSVQSQTLCGFHAVESGLRAEPVRVAEIVHDGARKDQRVSRLLALARARGVRVVRGDTLMLDRLAGEVRHQGIVGLLARAPTLGQSELNEWLSGVTQQTVVLLLDGLEDPRNIGACIRTGAAAGVEAIIMPSSTGAGLTPAALRVAEGGVHQVKIFEVGNWGQILLKLKKTGIWLIGTGEEGQDGVFDFDLSGPLALVVGSESTGMRPLTRKHCDATVNIPTVAGFSSLNVSVAAGVILFEIRRQRQLKGAN
tara:strand:+ start:324 stop:1082 length:759 start_codon:yes stop_codon:yes gene_type:complete